MGWVRGIDVSHWQGLIRPSWAEFAWIKASQGRSMRDPKMAEHHANLAGIARGPYHFYDFARTPQENADNFLRATAGRTWELPHVLDAEHGGAGSRARTADVLLDFLARVERATGRVPVVYTYASWWNNAVEARADFARYPLWIARYPTAYKDGAPPPVGATTGAAQPWRSWVVWQYSTASSLDRNVCTRAALDLLVGARLPPRPTPTKGTIMEALTPSEQHELLTIAQELRRSAARKAVAVRSKTDGRVWILSGAGRWWCKTRSALDLMIFAGGVEGVGVDGPAPVDQSWLDGIDEVAAPDGADLL